jgi:hypothetical protein
MSDKRYKDLDLSVTEREVRRSFWEVDARKAMTEYEKEQKALHKNCERLKAERSASDHATDTAGCNGRSCGRSRPGFPSHCGRDSLLFLLA